MPGAETGANVGARAKIWVKTGAAAWTEDRNGAQVFNFFGGRTLNRKYGGGEAKLYFPFLQN